jgi:hypothetical protein
MGPRNRTFVCPAEAREKTLRVQVRGLAGFLLSGGLDMPAVFLAGGFHMPAALICRRFSLPAALNHRRAIPRL